MENIYARQMGLIGGLLILLLAAITWVGGAYATDQNGQLDNQIQVDPQLLAKMEAQGHAGYLIYFREKADLTLAYDLPWETRGHYVVDALQTAAESSQRNVRLQLDRQGVRYAPFWIDNVIVVEESEASTLNSLLNFPEISSIEMRREPLLFEPVEPAEDQDRLETAIQAVESNLVRVKAPEVWDLGITGEGITVASIDTGVRYTHEALMNQYRGNLGGGQFDHNYHWWDPYAASSEPFDPHDHGSHVTGTIIGDDGGANQIGMAPGANWIACIGFTPSATDAGLLECAQFLTAPWDLNGDNPDPAMRPHIINNSWGSCGHDYDPWYQGVVDAWVAAGIYPVFANGNQRANCPVELGSVGTPARYGNVTGVGALGRDNGTLASYSLWGPSDVADTINARGYPFQKPQVSAPGTNRSAVRSSDTAYGTYQGTSMAAPHVSGLVALIWSAAPCLLGDYATTETIIEKTAAPANVGSVYPGHPNDGPDGIPNQATGWGEIDALEAVTAAIHLCRLTGTIITGQVTDAVTEEPLPGARIEARQEADNVLSTMTNSDGVYFVPFALPGVYTVTTELFSYQTAVITGVVVITDTVTEQNFSLIPAAHHAISGTVTDALTGWPLYARIEIEDTPLPPIWTNPIDGYYRIDLPEGDVYNLVVTSWTGGYEQGGRLIGPFFADQTELFTLTADQTNCTAPGYRLDYIYYQDFTTSDGDYTLSGGAPAPWQYGQPTSWPFSCAEGDGCWGTNLSGNYNHNAEQTLTSPLIDLSTIMTGTELLVRWQQAWHMESLAWDQAYAEVSINGGPWSIMWQNPEMTTQVDWTELIHDISDAVGGAVQLRWRFISDEAIAFNGLYVDRVAITLTDACAPKAGGLVVGNVYDANNGRPLVGASIVSDADSAFSYEVPLDPQVDDGFYILFVPEEAGEIEATMAGGYTAEAVVLDVTTGAVMTQDFGLNAGWLRPSPDMIETTVTLGGSVTLPFTLTNAGGAPAHFDLATTILAEDFEADFPPANWQVIDNGGDCVWQRNDEWPRPNYAGGDGFSAAADSDRCGSGTIMDTELRAPPLDLSAATVARLEFIAAYRHLGGSFFRVRASVDGGHSWDSLLEWTASVSPEGPGMPVTLDLTPYVGYDEVIISFHYQAPAWDWWAQIDQVRVIVDRVPWFLVAPNHGAVAAYGVQELTILVDAAVLHQPGVYKLAMHIGEDTPYVVPIVPVTVLVEASSANSHYVYFPVVTKP